MLVLVLVELELDGRSAAGLGAVAASLEMSGASTAGVVLISGTHLRAQMMYAYGRSAASSTVRTTART